MRRCCCWRGCTRCTASAQHCLTQRAVHLPCSVQPGLIHVVGVGAGIPLRTHGALQHRRHNTRRLHACSAPATACVCRHSGGGNTHLAVMRAGQGSVAVGPGVPATCLLPRVHIGAGRPAHKAAANAVVGGVWLRWRLQSSTTNLFAAPNAPMQPTSCVDKNGSTVAPAGAPNAMVDERSRYPQEICVMRLQTPC